MKLSVIILLILFTGISCRYCESDNSKLYFQKVEINLPACIENTIQSRFNKYPSITTLAVSFHLSVDSTKFIISDVNEMNFVKEYPPNYYSIRNNKCLLLYSGLESYIKVKDCIIPDEVKVLLNERQNQIIGRMIEPFHVEYKYFNFDSCISHMKYDTLLFNNYLPNSVKLTKVPFEILKIENE